jgi:hypothetical protein
LTGNEYDIKIPMHIQSKIGEDCNSTSYDDQCFTAVYREEQCPTSSVVSRLSLWCTKQTQSMTLISARYPWVPASTHRSAITCEYPFTRRFIYSRVQVFLALKLMRMQVGSLIGKIPADASTGYPRVPLMKASVTWSVSMSS